MALLYSWIQRVPSKKARQCRLSKAIEEIVRNLLDKAEQVEANKGNSFEAMFSAQPIHLPAVFLREAASYVRITSYLFSPRDQTNDGICKISALTKEELNEVNTYTIGTHFVAELFSNNSFSLSVFPGMEDIGQ